MLLDGCRSHQADVISGVPQGTVLGPLLFLAFINDLPESVKASDPRPFADDCLLYKLINCDADAESVQQDLLALEEWERKWQMKFHPEKCQVIHISTNKRHERHTVYRLHSHTLEAVDSGKYLGLTISDDFSWHRHVDAVAAKASRTLGFLRRNLGQCTREVKSTAYTSLVRPVLEYASPAWDPTSSEGIVKLEKVQRQAARFAHGNYSERDPGCVTRMVSDLGWETLESRRKKDRLTTLYKVRHGLVDMDTGDVLRLNDRRTRGQQRLYQPTANVKVYKDSFFPRTIQDWNRLPAAVTDSQTIEEFRAGLEQQVPTLRC